MKPDPHKTRISMRDIAKLAGVSHSTVSLALKDHPRISEELKQRIRKLCEEAGYRPDPMLAALAHYRLTGSETPVSSGIAWINAWPEPEDLRKHREFDLYWKGACAAAEQFGYQVEEFQIGHDMSPQQLNQQLSTRGIRGLLLPPHQIAPDWKDFPWRDYSVVRFGRSLEHPDCHLVTADQVANTVVAVNSIRARGYRRVGYVADEPNDRSHGMLFSAGYLYASSAIPEEDQVPVLDIAGMDTKAYARALLAWIRKHRVEAIFTNRSELIGVLEKSGVKVPGDIAVAATSVLDAHADAGIDQHSEEIGQAAFLMLNSLINDGALGLPKIFRQILIEGSWVDGTTLPDRK